MEAVIRRDPGRRGLCSTDAENPLCPGDLAAAGLHLAGEAAAVALVTGFWVPRGTPPACETDGPLGALFLASVLHDLGVRVWLITDALGIPVLAAGLRALGLPRDLLIAFPGLPRSSAADKGGRLAPRVADSAHGVNGPRSQSAQVDDWLREFFRRGPGSELTHLVAIERVGPSHTLTTFERQPRQEAVAVETFLEASPPEHHDQYHNMLGHVITEHHAPTHRLFEFVVEQGLPITMIGVGDGGNEIGMGSVLWEEIHHRVSGGKGGLVACRIATHYNVIAGTSNWGAYALAASMLWWRGEGERLRPLDRRREQTLLKSIVREGPAVDGVTGRQEPTVDGLPFETYIQALEGIRRLMAV